jgi:hypothetical protein
MLAVALFLRLAKLSISGSGRPRFAASGGTSPIFQNLRIRLIFLASFRKIRG